MGNDKDTTSNLDQVRDLQIRIGEVASLARLADEQFGDDADVSGPLSIIERELEQVRGALDDLISDGERREAKSRTQENDGPAQALSVLFEANDLLNMFRQYSEDSQGQKLTSGEWTLTEEISRRINRAVALLDGAVPHPAEGNDAAAPKSRNRDAHNDRITSDDASLAASELKALLDVLTGAATSDLTLFDETLETLAGTMIEKAQTLCSYFRPPESEDGPQGVAA